MKIHSEIEEFLLFKMLIHYQVFLLKSVSFKTYSQIWIQVVNLTYIWKFSSQTDSDCDSQSHRTPYASTSPSQCDQKFLTWHRTHFHSSSVSSYSKLTQKQTADFYGKTSQFRDTLAFVQVTASTPQVHLFAALRHYHLRFCNSRNQAESFCLNLLSHLVRRKILHLGCLCLEP